MARRTGFTLVELVVVVMILGILAAVAAPKLLNTSKTATENGVKQTLSVVRDAIERYAAQFGNPPADPSTDLITAKLLRPPFPSCPYGAAAGQEAAVAISAADPLVATGAADEGWMYNATTGEFIINSTGTSSDGATTYDQF